LLLTVDFPSSPFSLCIGLLITFVDAVVSYNTGVVQFSISFSDRTSEDFEQTRYTHGTIKRKITMKTIKSVIARERGYTLEL